MPKETAISIGPSCLWLLFLSHHNARRSRYISIKEIVCPNKCTRAKQNEQNEYFVVFINFCSRLNCVKHRLCSRKRRATRFDTSALLFPIRSVPTCFNGAGQHIHICSTLSIDTIRHSVFSGEEKKRLTNHVNFRWTREEKKRRCGCRFEWIAWS